MECGLWRTEHQFGDNPCLRDNLVRHQVINPAVVVIFGGTAPDAQISECLPFQELAGKYSGSGHFRSLVVFQYILHLLVIIRFCNGSSTVGGNHSGNGFRIEVHAVILGMNLLGENHGYCHYYESESFHCCFVFG